MKGLREGKRIIEEVKSFFVKCRAYVRVKGNVSEMFSNEMELHQSCVMSPFLFYIYVDSLVREREGGS